MAAGKLSLYAGLESWVSLGQAGDCSFYLIWAVPSWIRLRKEILTSALGQLIDGTIPGVEDLGRFR